MVKEKTTRKRRIIASAFLCAVAVSLILITRHVESLATIILPGAVVHWMISNEHRLVQEDSTLPNVPWPTKAALFVFLPILSLAVIVFWFPVYAKNWNPWGVYAIASFSLALLLVKLYERYLFIRRRIKESAVKSTVSL